jgi:putative ABC transport system ATP-binding protein
MVEPIINVENLRVIYNQGKSNEVRALEDINLKIFPHEYVVFYGPSGCGKSTLLYAISGLQAPTYGEVTVEAKKLSQMTKKEMVTLHQTGIGMIFQAFYLISSLTVWDNVCLPKVFRGEERSKRRTDGMTLLRRFSITEQAMKFPSELSGGQKQRVAIARSLVNNPNIILADEPVGNLDSESAANVLEILKQLNETDKKTVIMVTHNAEHLHYADRVVYMKDGRIVSEEVHKEKRPISVIKEEVTAKPIEISNELRILMRTFKNLSPQQIGVLLVPFKAKQLLFHVLSEITEEQMSSAENFLKELLFRNIDINTLEKNLDIGLDEGGAGWNKQRVKAFMQRVKGIMAQSEMLKSSAANALNSISDYLMHLLGVELDEDMAARFRGFVQLRIENKIDHFGFEKRLDTAKALGGMGFYKNTAEKIMRELELIMLLKYSA